MKLFLKSSSLVVFGLVGVLFLGGCASTSKSGSLSRADRARLLIEVANGAILEGDPTGALGNLVEAEALDPSLPELHHSRALAFYMKKDLGAAMASARKAVALRPEYADANSTLGKILLDRGALREAEAFLQKAARDPLYRDAYKARTNLGILYYRNGETTLAETQFNLAIEQEPINACVAYYYRGEIQSKGSKFLEAIRDYEKATQRFCGAYGEAHLALAKAYASSKQYQKARKKLLEVRDVFSNTPIADQAMDQLRYLP